jgi:glyoxylase-like metal-dependent hydrolase (beta-lactamase superfamily II)
MREFLPGVFTWPWFSEPHGYDFNGTLVLHDGGNLCIDPVDPPEAVLDRLDEEGLARILITNRNHTRAANRVRERTGAAVSIHPADAGHARSAGTVIDGELEVGGQVGPFTIVGVPGKSPGEVAFHDPARRLLIVGDAVIGSPTGRLSLLREHVMDDPAHLRSSVRQLLALDFEVLLVGDGAPIQKGGRECMRELVTSFPSA